MINKYVNLHIEYMHERVNNYMIVNLFKKLDENR